MLDIGRMSYAEQKCEELFAALKEHMGIGYHFEIQSNKVRSLMCAYKCIISPRVCGEWMFNKGLVKMVFRLAGPRLTGFSFSRSSFEWVVIEQVLVEMGFNLVGPC